MICLIYFLLYSLITARITEFNDYHSLFEQVYAAITAHMTVIVNP